MIVVAHMIGDYLLQNKWMATRKRAFLLPCLVHVALYALAVAVICRWFDWRLLVVAGTHFLMDRYGLAAKWRQWFSGDQELPWIITADNSVHLLVLWLLAGVR
jgi:hypothetical protein